MKKIILLIATLTLTGCHFGGGPVVVHKVAPAKTVVVETVTPTPAPSHGHSHSTTVVVEEVQYCDYYGEMPYYADPYQCFYYHTHTECDWYVGFGCYEVWTWDEHSCHWFYSFDYCV